MGRRYREPGYPQETLIPALPLRNYLSLINQQQNGQSAGKIRTSGAGIRRLAGFRSRLLQLAAAFPDVIRLDQRQEPDGYSNVAPSWP